MNEQKDSVETDKKKEISNITYKGRQDGLFGYNRIRKKIHGVILGVEKNIMLVLKTKAPSAVACSNCFQLIRVLKRNQSAEIQPCLQHQVATVDSAQKCSPATSNRRILGIFVLSLSLCRGANLPKSYLGLVKNPKARLLNFYEAWEDYINAENRPSCPSEIYCHGRLLHTIQMAQLYNDSKTFVDKKLKYKPAFTLERFDTLMQETEDRPTRKQLQDFVNDHFEDGNELEAWTPPDWTNRPQFVDNIVDPNYRQWAIDLNNLWTNLTRKMIIDVKNNPDQYSIVYVPNGLVIPGGRFTEFYYWDTYWIVRGLLLSEMFETVRGILLNFLSMVSQFGFVPNGGRVYYLERSQPPLLTPMVLSYYEATNDIDFLQSHISLLEKEFNFWVTKRTVEVKKGGKTFKLARYFAPSSGPRPESYSEDYNSAAFLPTQLEKEDLYMDLKSAAESGWDFSSRWFITNKTNQGNISSIHTRYIIPVDLNAFIFWNAKILSQFYTILQNPEKAAQYAEIANDWLQAVTAVLWHPDLGIWLDYDLRNNIRRDYFYPSNLAPLWTDCYDKNAVNEVGEAVLKYIDDSNIMTTFLGGLPASLEMTGQQWDRPNAWPPLQIIAIQGLDRMNIPEASERAKELAKNWVYSNYKGFHDSQEMFEKARGDNMMAIILLRGKSNLKRTNSITRKYYNPSTVTSMKGLRGSVFFFQYDAENPGRYGSGGEYIVQAGFGWTNGVIMELLNTYGKDLRCMDKDICNVIEPIKQNGFAL